MAMELALVFTLWKKVLRRPTTCTTRVNGSGLRHNKGVRPAVTLKSNTYVYVNENGKITIGT